MDLQTSAQPVERAGYDFAGQVGHLMRRAYQRHVAIFQEVIPDSRLTGAQFSVLCALRDRGPSSLSEICKATAIDQATVRGIIERLKARGLVGTSADALDRRKVIVAVEPEGARLVEEIIPIA
ncbi:MAG: MarR family transcriptional regulator, partial [Comamonadaceae bacterium]